MQLKIVAKILKGSIIMSRFDKILERFKSEPKDFTYEELIYLLNNLGFYENSKGHTSGSRVEFKDLFGRKLLLHKPHPNNIIKPYIIKSIINSLKEWRII